jgi:hypothetical protein
MYFYAQCRYAECHCAESHGAITRVKIFISMIPEADVIKLFTAVLNTTY